MRQAGLAAAVEAGGQRQQAAFAQQFDRRGDKPVARQRGDAGRIEAAFQPQQRRGDQVADPVLVQRGAGDQGHVGQLAAQPAEQAVHRLRRQHHVAGEAVGQRLGVYLAGQVAQHRADAQALCGGLAAQGVAAATRVVERTGQIALTRGGHGHQLVPAQLAGQRRAAAGGDMRAAVVVRDHRFFERGAGRVGGAPGQQVGHAVGHRRRVGVHRALVQIGLLAGGHRVGVVLRRRAGSGQQIDHRLGHRVVAQVADVGRRAPAVQQPQQRQFVALGAAHQRGFVVGHVQFDQRVRAGLDHRGVEALAAHQGQSFFGLLLQVHGVLAQWRGVIDHRGGLVHAAPARPSRPPSAAFCRSSRCRTRPCRRRRRPRSAAP